MHAAAPGDQVIATQTRSVALKAYGDTALFSSWNGKTYSLVASVGGGAPVVLGVPPQAQPFDADIGPDAAGHPRVVLTQCSAGACGLSLLALDGSPPVPTPIVLDRAGPVRPTLWHDRVAWIGRGERMMVGSLSGAAPVRALPRVPYGGRVLEAELSGGRLAVTTVSFRVSGGICGWREVRVYAVKTSANRVVGSQLCGLNGQIWVGPTFAGGKLYYARSCNAESSCGASAFGAYRYDFKTHRFALAGDSRAVDGWAYAGQGTAYRMALGEFMCAPMDPCSVVRSTGLSFRRVRAPVAPYTGHS
jgi:hypothetical protein